MSTIVIDTCAGEEQGREALAAAAIASLDLDVQMVAVGDEDLITSALDGMAHDAERLRVVHAADPLPDDVVPGDIREVAPRSSIAVGLEITARDPDAIFVSAGQPAAIVSLALQTLGRLPAVDRAALAAVYPTLRHRGPNDDPFALLLDVGATVRVRSQDLLFFAYMGSAYARAVSKTPRPTIGLLNMGTEANKGDAPLREAHAWIREDPRLNFVGNVEGNDIPTGGADVIVCEGYVGNIALKMAEGVSEVFKSLGKQAFKQRLIWRLGLVLLSRGLRRLKDITDYREYGGAPLLGFRAPVIKAHGRSGEVAIANAIKVAAKAVREGVCQEIERAVADFQARRVEAEAEAKAHQEP